MKLAYLLPATMSFAFLAGCEVDKCNSDGRDVGGVCVPREPVSTFMPVCGNGVCETHGRYGEDDQVCAADCDPGYKARAMLISNLTAIFYNDHVGGQLWPNGVVNAGGACRDGGSATVTGMAGRTGNDNFHQLTFQLQGCRLDFGSFVGTITVDGGPVVRDAMFNNVEHTNVAHITGTGMLSGTDGRTPFDPTECELDVDDMSTSTSNAVTGSICGKEIREIVYDDEAH